jgi:GT2 family glycosyltransferase
MTAEDRLAVIIVSHNSARWLAPCLSSVFAKAGDIDLEVVVVDSGSTDDTVDLVRREFPDVRLIPSENHGFAAANNRGLDVVDTKWILFLNPDTRLLSGTLAELVALLRARPSVGLAGVRQVDENGVLSLTMRRFPNAARFLFQGLGAERLPFRSSWMGERVRDVELYDHQTQCDWTSGSFMVARKEAIDAVGRFDERFFLYCEETDLCLRMRHEGWDVVHLPQMTIFHQSSAMASDGLVRQMALARRQYIAKHFALPHRAAATLAIGVASAVRFAWPGRSLDDRRRRTAERIVLSTLMAPLADSRGPFAGSSAADHRAHKTRVPR